MKYVFLVVLGIALNVKILAQSSCDNLYAKAVQYQQTMTVASQNQAITYFQKARACYDSDAKKKLCASQIATCKNTIALIKKNTQGKGIVSGKKKSEETKDSTNNASKQEKIKDEIVPVELAVSESIIKFKAKGGEFKKIKITCNYDDWKVTEYPEWITYSISKENEIVLEASKNPLKEERSGMIKIECRGTTTTFAVLQQKKGLLNNIGL